MSNNFISSDMIRGHIDTIILLSLVNGDKHTNEIRDEIENKAGGQYKVKQGTFYSALQRLAKNGLVSEYRSSTADSIRRKYLHLTEKGLEYVNKNIDEWNYSKNVINNMISDDNPIDETPTIKSFPIENAESEFENLLNNSQDIADFDFKEENSEQLDDYFKQINETLQTEMEIFTKTPPILEENSIQEEIQSDEVVDAQEQINEDFNEELPALTEEFEQNESYEEAIENVEQDLLNDNTEEIFVDSEKDSNDLPEILPQDEFLTEQEQEAFDQSEILVQEETEEFLLEKEIESETELAEAIFEENEENYEENIESNEKIDEKEESLVDNSYVNDELLFGNDKKEIYSQLLDKLFPDRKIELEEKVEENVLSEEQDETYFEQISEFEELVTQENTFEEIESQQSCFVEPEIIEKEEVYDEKPALNYSIKKQTYDNSIKFDYSDILEYANQEGFKVRTSYSTNKSEIGKVLVNKLNFHASWLFCITMLVELILIYFVFKTNTGLSSAFYMLSGITLFILPIYYSLIYFSNRNFATHSLSSFKNTLEIVFIICLNLILLVSAFAIISDINFSSTKDLLRYIILPVLLIINIPLFYIYKYVLLQKSSYYTK